MKRRFCCWQMLAVISRKTTSMEASIHSGITLSLLSAREGLLPAPRCCVGMTKERFRKSLPNPPSQDHIPDEKALGFMPAETCRAHRRYSNISRRHSAVLEPVVFGSVTWGTSVHVPRASVVSSAEGDKSGPRNGLWRELLPFLFGETDHNADRGASKGQGRRPIPRHVQVCRFASGVSPQDQVHQLRNAGAAKRSRTGPRPVPASCPPPSTIMTGLVKLQTNKKHELAINKNVNMAFQSWETAKEEVMLKTHRVIYLLST